MVLQVELNLFQDVFVQNIVIVSLIILLVILWVIDSFWCQEWQNQNVWEIVECVGLLYDKFVFFVQDFDEVGLCLQ